MSRYQAASPADQGGPLKVRPYSHRTNHSYQRSVLYFRTYLLGSYYHIPHSDSRGRSLSHTRRLSSRPRRLPLAVRLAVLEGVDAEAILRPLPRGLVRLPVPVVAPAACRRSTTGISLSARRVQQACGRSRRSPCVEGTSASASWYARVATAWRQYRGRETHFLHRHRGRHLTIGHPEGST